jgi:hypothetical protein
MFLKAALADAREAALRPRDFFGRKPEAESWGGPAARLALWSFAAGLLDSAVVSLGLSDRPGGLVLNLLTPVLFPLFGLLAGGLAALALHLAWKVLGGSAPLAASWRAAAAVAFTMPLDVLTHGLGTLNLLPALLRYALLAYAGQGVHGLSRGKAWGLAAAVALFHVVSVALL